MSEQIKNQDFVETEPLNDLPVTAEQADKARAGGEGKTVKIDFCKTDMITL